MRRQRMLPIGLVGVRGPSMVPALRHGDILLVRWARRPEPVTPGEVVIVDLPDRPLGVKRALRPPAPGPDSEIWVQGDNDLATTDSRAFGALPLTAVRGRVVARVWPRPGRVPAKRPSLGSDRADGDRRD